MFVLVQRSLRGGRLATFVYFALNGFALGMWVVHIPAVEHQVGISHAVLGSLLLLLGGGAFVGMQVAGPLADRFGARAVVPASAALCSAALIPPGLATGPWTLAGALLLFGFGNGCLDVSMNAHAVQVERGYQRPVMSAFHAVWSIGGVGAALVGARTLGWGWHPASTLTLVAVAGLVTTVLAWPALLHPERAVGGRPGDGHPGNGRPGDGAAGGAADGAADGAGGGAGRGGRSATPPRIWAMGGLALILMLCEGVANDWSVLAARDVLDAPAPVAAFAYGAFATAMTVGRFLADRVAGRYGPVAVLRYGSAVAAVGLATVVVSPSVGVALAGWAVFGIGLSGCIPQLFSAAGHADQEATGANVSRVVGLGYLGSLAGPAIIGPLTEVVPLNVAFLLPVAFCVIAAGTAGILRPHPVAEPATREATREAVG